VASRQTGASCPSSQSWEGRRADRQALGQLQRCAGSCSSSSRNAIRTHITCYRREGCCAWPRQFLRHSTPTTLSMQVLLLFVSPEPCQRAQHICFMLIYRVHFFYTKKVIAISAVTRDALHHAVIGANIAGTFIRTMPAALPGRAMSPLTRMSREKYMPPPERAIVPSHTRRPSISAGGEEDYSTVSASMFQRAFTIPSRSTHTAGASDAGIAERGLSRPASHEAGRERAAEDIRPDVAAHTASGW